MTPLEILGVALGVVALGCLGVWIQSFVDHAKAAGLVESGPPDPPAHEIEFLRFRCGELVDTAGEISRCSLSAGHSGRHIPSLSEWGEREGAQLRELTDVDYEAWQHVHSDGLDPVGGCWWPGPFCRIGPCDRRAAWARLIQDVFEWERTRR